MRASAARPARFVRRGGPAERTRVYGIPVSAEELAIVEADAASLGMSVEDYVAMPLLGHGQEAKGDA